MTVHTVYMCIYIYISCSHVFFCAAWQPMHWPAPHGAWPVAQGVVAAVGPETVTRFRSWLSQDESLLSIAEKILRSKKSPTGPTGYGPPKPEYPIARSQLTKRGPLVRSYSIFDGLDQSVQKLLSHLIANFWYHLMYRWYCIKLHTARNGVTRMWCYVGWESFLYKKYISPSSYHYEHMYM